MCGQFQLGLLDRDLAFNSNAAPNTLQPLYNTVHYNTVLDITRFKDGSNFFFNIIYTFLFDDNTVD